MILEIKISGSGSTKEIIRSLNSLIQTLECADWSDVTGTHEDDTLITTISTPE